MFALGEVTYIYRGPMAFCIAVAMLICVVLSLRHKGKFIGEIIFLYIGFLLGFIYIFMFELALPSVYFEQGGGYYLEGQGIITDYSKEKDSVTIKLGGGFGGYKVIIYGNKENESREYHIGEEYIIKGEVNNISPPSNPGIMDMKRYYYSKNIIFTARENNITLEKYSGNGKYSPFKRLSVIGYKIWGCLYTVRERLAHLVYENTDALTGGFVAGVLFGDKSRLDNNLKKLFSANGIGHILVISGLHISLIGGLLYKLLSLWMTNKKLVGIITSLIVVFYGVMTGAGIATLRAVFMLLVAYMGKHLGRDYDMLTAMSLALLVMIIKNPFSILDGGMILSFGAIGGIALGDYLVKELCVKKRSKLRSNNKNALIKKIFSGIITALVTSLGINLILTPIICCIYYGFPLYSIFLNLIVTSVFGIMVIICIIGVIMSMLLGEWGGFVFSAVGAGLRGIIYLCECFGKFPFSYINTGYPGIKIILLYYFFLLLLVILLNRKLQRRVRNYIYDRWHTTFSVKKWRRLIFVCCLFLSLLSGGIIYSVYRLQQGEMIIFADVGQGDGILIRTREGCSIVIDGGSASNNNLGEYVIVPMLKYHNMVSVDYWFVSHTDMDHTSSLVYVLGEQMSGIEIKNIVLGTDYSEQDDDDNQDKIVKLAGQRGINIIYMKLWDYVETESMKISCVAPVTGEKYDDKNQSSLGLLYTTPYIEILFTGDMDSRAIDYMLDMSGTEVLNNSSNKEHFLKIPHHGSRYSVNRRLYRLFAGGTGIISCGKTNSYGHPHRETIEALLAEQIEYYATDDNGAVIITVNRKGNVNVKTYIAN